MRHVLGVLFSLTFALIVGSTVGALEIPSAPPLDKPIVDQTKTLNQAQVDQLADQIKASRKDKAYQLGILMIPSLEGRSLEEYSIEVARKWGIGEKTKNNGVLLIIAKSDRQLRIEVGNGLEGELTDAESGRIIRNTITPLFKNGKFFEGIQAGVTSIQAQVEGRASPDADQERMSGEDILSLIMTALVMIFFFTSWAASILARSKSWWAGGVVGGASGGLLAFASGWAIWALVALPLLVVGGLLLDFFVSRNFKQHKERGDDPSWWAGGGWLGGSGGGSSGGGSFGGGGFSGGGASGSW